MHYTITLSQAELDLVHDDLARSLGRMLDPKPVREPRARVPKRRPVYPAKPPRLTEKRYAIVTRQWEEACAYPQRWRNQLIMHVARETGRDSDYDSVCRAWGLDPVTGLAYREEAAA
jgi:hypothetical protein